MKCKKLTAILLSTVTLAATPSVPVLCNTVQNITITAAAASPYDTLTDSFMQNQLGYRIYQTTRGSKYAAVVSGDAGLTSLTIPAQVTYQNETYSVDRIEEGAFEGSAATSVSISVNPARLKSMHSIILLFRTLNSAAESAQSRRRHSKNHS